MATQTAVKSEYTIKGIKTFMGMEGRGFNATLYRNGRKAAFFIDDASGGPLQIDWVNKKEEEIFKAFIEEEREKIPADQMYHGTPYRGLFNDEIWLGDKVNELENKKRIRRLAKKNTVVQIGDEIGTDKMSYFKGTGPEIRAWIEKKYGDQKLKFLNDEL